MQMRYFHCPVCHIVVTAPKTTNFKKLKYKGQRHRKYMYCSMCKEERQFILDEAFMIRA